MKKESVLVIGGGGFLGYQIVKDLLVKGYQVTSFSRTKHKKLLNLPIRVISGDIRSISSISKACEGHSKVFLVAAKVGHWGTWKEYYDTNVLGAENVIQACLNQNVATLIYTSSPSVSYSGLEDINYANESIGYSNSFLSHYSQSKMIAEKIVLSRNSDALKTIALRPHLIWGIDDPHLIPRLLARVQSGGLFKIGFNKPKVDMTHVKNASYAHIQAAIKLDTQPEKVAGNAYFISDDSPVELWEWIDQLLLRLGLPKVKATIPYQLAFSLAALIELYHKHIPQEKEPRFTRFIVSQISHSHFFDISSAKSDLAYSSQIDINEELTKYIKHLISGDSLS